MSAPATFRPGGPADRTREVARESPSPSRLDHGLGVLELGRGTSQSACELLQRAGSGGPHPGIAIVAPDLLEASVRCGRKRAAAVLLQSLAGTARAAGTPLALGLLARSSALLASDDLAEDLYLEAITQLGRSHDPVQLPRGNLLSAQWLRPRRPRRHPPEQPPPPQPPPPP